MAIVRPAPREALPRSVRKHRRKTLGGALSMLLAGVLGSVLLTSCSSDPVPTAVTVRWADKTYKAVQVSWKDSNAPNRISVVGVVSASPSYVKYLAASERNTFAIPTTAFPPDGTFRIAVAVGTSNAGITSKAALSPKFDTDGPVRPERVQARPSGKDVVVTWRAAPSGQDFSPADPLDVPAGRQVYVPVLGQAGRPMRAVGPGSTATRQVLKNLKPPYLFRLRATNEWSTLSGGGVSARSTSTTAGVPSVGLFSRQIQIQGRTVQQELNCAGDRCRAQRTTTAGLSVVLQTQNVPGGPWLTAGRTKTVAGGHFKVRVRTPATRSYRAYAPVDNRPSAYSAASSSVGRLTRSKVLITAAGYQRGNVKRRNELVTAVATVRPAVNGRATVQFWTGRTWVSVKSVPIVRGRTAVRFRAIRPGAFAYRFAVPGTAYRGRPVFANTTPSLVLRVL